MQSLTERKTLNVVARRKQAIRMSKLAKTSAFKAKVARKKKRMASSDDLQKRARKAAKMKVIHKFSGMDKADYASLAPARKFDVDQRVLSKKSALIPKIAKKLFKDMKKNEVERLRKLRQGN